MRMFASLLSVTLLAVVTEANTEDGRPLPPPTAAAANQITGGVKTCIEDKATAASSTIRTAPESDKMKWKKECEDVARTQFEAAGGTKEDYARAQREAAVKDGADNMKTCVQGEATKVGKTDKTATVAERKDWAEACDVTAKAAFEASGGTAQDWEQAKRSGAERQGSAQMTTCMEGKGDIKTATPEQKKTWFAACEGDAKAAFETAGGTAEEWEVARKEGAKDKSAEIFKTCIEDKATTASKTMTTASDDEKKTWRGACDADVKAAFEAAGGDAKDWEVAKRDGAKGAGSDMLKACVDAAAVTAGVTMSSADATQKATFKKGCDSAAKQAFEAAGGSADEWSVAKKEGARKKGAESLKACVYAAAKAASVTMTTATETQKETFQKGCEAGAKQEFEASGGKPEEWDLEKKRGALSGAKDAMTACIEDAAESASKTIKDATDAEKKTWGAACDETAKAAFEAAGGRGKEWEVSKKEGARDAGSEMFKACAEAEAETATVTMETASVAQKDAFRTTCEAAAKEAFEAAGGSSKEWDAVKDKGARSKGTDRLKACFVAAAEAANVDMAAATDVQKKGWATGCENDAKAAFEAAGGKSEDWEVAKKKGARGAGSDQLQACVEGAASQASKAIESATPTQKKAWKDTCDVEAKAAFEAAGGTAREWEAEKKEGAKMKGAERMTACIEKKAGDASLTVETADSAQMKTWSMACDTEAKLAFEAAGGKEDDWKRAKKEGARSEGAERMKSCVDAAAEDANKTVKAASDSDKKTWATACEADAKAAFQASGGTEEEWELAKREGAQDKGADKMKACVEKKAETAGKRVKTGSASEKKTWTSACADDAKADFEAAGGSKKDWNNAREKGAEKKGVDMMKACFDQQLEAASKTVATASNTDKASYRAACDEVAKENYEASGGTTDWALAKTKGAESQGANAMKECVKAAAEAATKDVKTATDPEKKTWQDGCKTEARALFEASGGKPEDFNRARAKGAASAGADKMQACLAAKELAAGGAGATDAQKTTWRGECDADVKAEFEAAGGDAKVFKAALQEARIEKMVAAGLACMADCGETDACKISCEAEAKELSKELGGNTARFAKDKQAGIRGETSQAFKACMDDGGTKTTCKTKAKEVFLANGGSEAQLDGEVRRGAGDVAAKTLQSCVKEADGDKSAASQCLTDACTSLADAGGEAADCWLDRKQALLRWTLQHCTVETCTDAEAKAYFKTALLGEESDWSDEDWANVLANKDKATNLADTAKVDARFALSQSGETSSTLKTRVEGSSAAYADAAKTALGAASATFNGVSDSMSATEASIGVRLEFADAAAATAAETTLRNGDANTAVAAAARRLGLLGSGRRLTAVSTGEGSQVVSEADYSASFEASLAPSTAPTAAPATAPTAAPPPGGNGTAPTAAPETSRAWAGSGVHHWSIVLLMVATWLVN